MIKVLFVCLGNICRSPLAEAIFDKKIKEMKLSDKIQTDSCGTGGYHIGGNPDPRSIATAAQHSIPMDHKARQLDITDGKEFQYILAMDKSNLRNIIHALSMKPEGLYLMRAFDPAGRDENVPDPYYGGDDGFEKVYQMLDRSMDELIQLIIRENDLT